MTPGRLIHVHPLRPLIDLAGAWDFLPVARPTRRPPPGAWPERLAVPGVWESSIAHCERRGLGWFRRRFRITEHGTWRLTFGAVSHTATVVLDGRTIGSHYGAHTAFTCDATLAAGTHELCVLVDNRYGTANPLSAGYQDIYTWGGITRAVYAERLPRSRWERVTATPQKAQRGDAWQLLLDARVISEAGRGEDGPAHHAAVSIDDVRIGALPVRRGRLRGMLRLPRLKPWSPAAPHLHRLRIDLCRSDGAIADAWQERIGLRTVTTRSGRILLNGQPIVLKGVNRHEFHPDTGPAVPLAVQLRDIEILRDLGANFVRGAHYPNDPLFLDLCDEHGLLFWDECSHWQPKEPQLRDPAFLKASLRQLDEMIAQHRHHPCIILWGFLNEADTDTSAGRRAVAQLARACRRADPTRLTTFASMKPDTDRAFDLVDVVSLNLYPGWYGGRLDSLDARLKAALTTLRRRGGGRPLVWSEFGAGAITGSRSFEPRKWTEGYQADLLSRIIAFARASGRISGVALWQYHDVRTSADLALNRIREYNNKGILSEHRAPKQAYAAVRAEFAKNWPIARA